MGTPYTPDDLLKDIGRINKLGSTGGEAPPDLDALIQAAATRHNVDPDLVRSVMRQESQFNPKALSKVGAQGLMQLMPETAKGLGVIDAFDPEQNIEGGVKYLKAQMDAFGGNVDYALAAYNAGPGAVKKYGGVPPYRETLDYVQRITSDYQSRRRTLQPPPEGQPATQQAQNVPGMVQPGNIDLFNRPHVKNSDGSVSTVRSISANIDGKEVLLPTVTDDGRVVSNEEAIDIYRKSGKHLGIFDSPQSATAYAEQLHNQYAAGAYDKPASYTEQDLMADLDQVNKLGMPALADIRDWVQSGELGNRLKKLREVTPAGPIISPPPFRGEYMLSSEEQARLKTERAATREQAPLQQNLTAAETFQDRVRDMDPEHTGVLASAKREVKKGALFPFIRDMMETSLMLPVLNAAKKMERGEALSQDEQVLLDSYAAYAAAAQQFEPGILDRAAGVAINIPAFAAEFGATSGVYGAGKKVGQEAAVKVLRNIIGQRLSGLAGRVVGWGVGSLAQVPLAAAPTIAERTVERQIPKVGFGNDPNQIAAHLDGKGEDFATALAKSFGLSTVDIASERTGVIAEKIMQWAKPRFITRWMEKRGLKLGESAAKAIEKIGWNGIVGEVFEEEVAKPFQNAIQGDPLSQGVLDPQQLAVEALGFSLFGGAAHGLGYGLNAPGKVANRIWYRGEIARLNSAAQEQYAGRNFNSLNSEEQANVLYGLTRNAVTPQEQRILFDQAKRMGMATMTAEQIADGMQKILAVGAQPAEIVPLAADELKAISEHLSTFPGRPAAPAEITGPEKRLSEEAPSMLAPPPVSGEVTIAGMTGPAIEGPILTPDERAGHLQSMEEARVRELQAQERQRRAQEELDRQDKVQQEQLDSLKREEEVRMGLRSRASADGREVVVYDRRPIPATFSLGESEYEWIQNDLDRIAEQNYYADSADMLRSLEEKKPRGKALTEDEKYVLALANKLSTASQEKTVVVEMPPPPTETTPQRPGRVPVPGLDELPAPAEGYRRLYRGESSTAEAVPDWVKEQPEYQSRRKAYGRWWTADPEIAMWYVRDSGPNGRLVYQDVPIDVAAESRVLANPEAMKFSADPANEYFLPMGYAGRGETMDQFRLRKLWAETTRLVEAELELEDAAKFLARMAATARTPAESEQLSGEAREMADAAAQAHARRIAAEEETRRQADLEKQQPVGPEITGSIGKDTAVIIPGLNKEYGARYAVVSGKRLTPSNDPETWAKRENAFQTRNAYGEDKTVQYEITQQGHAIDPRRIHSNDPTQQNGPPTVRVDGLVAGGNRRTLMQLIAYRDGHGQAIRDHLVENAELFGINPATIPPENEWPMLVRVLKDAPTDRGEMFRIGDELNYEGTAAYSGAERAVVAASYLSDEQFARVADMLAENDWSVRDLIRNKNEWVAELMVNSGMFPPAKRTQFIDSASGQLTEAGKDLFEDAVLGKVIDDATLIADMRRNIPSIKGKLERSLNPLARIRAAGTQWDITDYLKRALKLHLAIDRVRSTLKEAVKGWSEQRDYVTDLYLHPDKFSGVTAQLSYGGDRARATVDPITEALAKLLERNGPEVKESLQNYIKVGENIAENQEGFGFYEPPKPWEAFTTHIGKPAGIEVTEKMWGQVVPQAEPAAPLQAAPETKKAVTKEDLYLPPPPPAAVAPEPTKKAKAKKAAAVKPDIEGVQTVAEFRRQAEAAGIDPKQVAGAVALIELRAQKLGITPDELMAKVAVRRGETPDVGPNVLMQKSEKAPVWISKAAEMVEQKLPNAFNGDQALATLRNSGVKAEEIKWLGLDEFLAGKKKVSKQELTDFIRANQIEVEDVTKGEQPSPDQADVAPQVEWPDASMYQTENREGWGGEVHVYTPVSGEGFSIVHNPRHPRGWVALDQDGTVISEGVDSYAGAQDIAQTIYEEVWQGSNSDYIPAPGTTKYFNYTVPGEHKNYTELLLTLPVRTATKGLSPEEQAEFDRLDKMDPLEAGEKLMERRWELYQKAEKLGLVETPMFTNSHWDEANVLAHVRMDERTDADGKRVLFVDEVQSDWHQQGKKRGYIGGNEAAELIEHAKDILGRTGERPANLTESRAYDVVFEENSRTQTDRARVIPTETHAILGRYNAATTGGSVPDAPFKTDWHELAMKRVLRWAAERGYDRVAWATGEQVTELYNLAKHVDTVRYESLPNTDHGVIYAIRGADVVIEKKIEDKDLENYVGKDAAQKLLNAKQHAAYLFPELQAAVATTNSTRHEWELEGGQPGFDELRSAEWEQAEISRPFEIPPARRAAAKAFLEARRRSEQLYEMWKDLQTLSGQDLRIGGEWAKNLYDSAIPNFLRKYGKKWGAKVGEATLDSKAAAKDVHVQDGGLTVVWRNALSDEVHGHRARNIEEAQRFANELKSQSGTRVHSIDITPEMKKSVSQGQYLFQDEAKGAVEFLTDGKAIIHLFENADFSTLVHELFHVFRRGLTPDELALAEKAFGVKDGKWGRTHEEKAARGFERWLHEGKAPDARLVQLFQQFKQWMREIYEKLAGSSINVRLSDDARELYSKMFTPTELEAPPRIREPGRLVGEGGNQFQQGQQSEFGTRDEAMQWAMSNKDSLLGVRVYERADGSAYAEYQSKTETLYQKNGKKLQPPPSMAIPGFEPLLAEKDRALTETAGKNLSEELLASKGDITGTTREIEQQSPLFRGTAASPQSEMFGAPPVATSQTGRTLSQEERNRLSWLAHDMETNADVYGGHGDQQLAQEVLGVTPEKWRAIAGSLAAMKLRDYLEQTSPTKLRQQATGKEPVTSENVMRMFGELDDIAQAAYAQNRENPYGLCSQCAFLAVERFGGYVVGYQSEDNPAAKAGESEGGHDFAVVDKWIIDPWIHAYYGETGLYDTTSAADQPKVRELYGDPDKWEDVPSQPRPWESPPQSNDTLFQLGDNREWALRQRIADGTRQLGSMLSDTQRALIARDIQAAEAELRKLQEKPKEAAPAVTKLWLPTTEATNEAPTGRVAPLAPPPPAKSQSAPTVAKPAGRTEPAQRPQQTAGRGVGAPAAAGPATGAEPKRRAIADVPSAQLDEPVRQRGTPIYSEAEWKAKTELFRLPENLPVPTRRLSPDNARLLIFPGQREIAEAALSALDQTDAVVLATSTGTGKTYLAAALIAEEKPKNVLILTANKGLIHNDQGWSDVAANFGVHVRELPPGAQTPTKPGVYATTYNTAIQRVEDYKTMTGGIAAFPWDMVIADESAYGRRWYAEDNKFGQLLKNLTRNSRKAVFMSATPFHHILEVGYLEKLGLWKNMGFDNWAKQFGIRFKDGAWIAPNAPKKLAKLRQQLIERGQFINLDRIMDGYHATFGMVPMTVQARAKLNDIAKAFELAKSYFRERGQSGMLMGAAGNEVTFTKNFVERLRLPETIEVAKKLHAQGWRVLFFSENKREVEEIFEFLRPADNYHGGRISRLLPKLPGIVETLQAEFGDKLANYSGPHSAMRSAELSAFKRGEKPFLFATYAAGGVGVSLHDTDGNFPRAAVYIGLPWSGIMLDQAIGRPWRFGTKSDVKAVFLTSDAAPEVELVTTKVGPRLESLRAAVSGLKTDDPMVARMRNIDAVLDYDLGNSHDAEMADFQRTTPAATAITSYAELPIGSAEAAKNRGMKLPGQEQTAVGTIRLFQDEEDEQKAKDVTDAARAAAHDRDLSPPPGTTGAPEIVRREIRKYQPVLRSMAQEERSAFIEVANADAATGAAETTNGGNAGDPGPAAAGRWRRSLDLLRKSKAGTGLSWGWQNTLTSGRGIIKDVGGKVGQEVVTDIREYHVLWGNTAGPWVTELGDIVRDLKLDNDEFAVSLLSKEGKSRDYMVVHFATERRIGEKEAAKLVDGALARAKDKIPQAVARLTELFNGVADRAQEAGVEVEIYDAGGPRYVPFPERDPAYAPHSYDPEVYDRGSELHQKALQAIMARENVGLAAAEHILDKMQGRDVPLAANVEKAREGDAPGYGTDFSAIARYLEKAAEAVARTEVFGQRRSALYAKIADIEGEDERVLVNTIMDGLLAKKPRKEGESAFVGTASDWTILTKMAFSAIPNFSQGVNAALRTNTRSAVKALADTVAHYKDAARALKLSGASLEQMHAEMMREFGARRPIVTKFLEGIGFMEGDIFSRAWAVNTARIYLEDYALPALSKDPQGFYRRTLHENFSLSDAVIDMAIVRGGWEDADLMRAGKRLSDDTQFTFDPTELPPAWRGNAFIHVATLLKSYAFKQGVLVRDALWEEAKKGNFRPWVPFVVLFPIIGELIADLSKLVRGDFSRLAELFESETYEPVKLLKRAAGNIGYVGGLGIASTFIDTLTGGRDLLQMAAGPFYSDVARTVEEVWNFAKDVDQGDEHKGHSKLTGFDKAGRAMRRWIRKTFVPAKSVLSVTHPDEGQAPASKKHELTPVP